jgi:hypothetical protein
MSVIKHPSSAKLQGDLSARFERLRKQHEIAVSNLWLGALARNFTDAELAVLSDYLCPNDYALLKQAGRKSEMPAKMRKIISD